MIKDQYKLSVFVESVKSDIKSNKTDPFTGAILLETKGGYGIRRACELINSWGIPNPIDVKTQCQAYDKEKYKTPKHLQNR